MAKILIDQIEGGITRARLWLSDEDDDLPDLNAEASDLAGVLELLAKFVRMYQG